jgi:hypothetical protein
MADNKGGLEAGAVICSAIIVVSAALAIIFKVAGH